MNEEQRVAEYLAKAKEADGRAAKAHDALSREAWEKIGASYRELARRKNYPN
jgi:hypothetical protein